MVKVKNSLNAHEFPKNYEKITQPSLTVPDQTMTIREIMERYARGLSFDGTKVPLYDGEDDVLNGVNWNTLDIEEQEQFRQQVQDELFELQRQRLAAEAAAARPESQPPAPKQSAPTGLTDLKVNQDGTTSPIS